MNGQPPQPPRSSPSVIVFSSLKSLQPISKSVSISSRVVYNKSIWAEKRKLLYSVYIAWCCRVSLGKFLGWIHRFSYSLILSPYIFWKGGFLFIADLIDKVDRLYWEVLASCLSNTYWRKERASGISLGMGESGAIGFFYNLCWTLLLLILFVLLLESFSSALFVSASCLSHRAVALSRLHTRNVTTGFVRDLVLASAIHTSI